MLTSAPTVVHYPWHLPSLQAERAGLHLSTELLPPKRGVSVLHDNCFVRKAGVLKCGRFITSAWKERGRRVRVQLKGGQVSCLETDLVGLRDTREMVETCEDSWCCEIAGPAIPQYFTPRHWHIHTQAHPLISSSKNLSNTKTRPEHHIFCSE